MTRQLSSSFDPNYYYNPSDTYSETMEVKYGSSISGRDFEISSSYFMHVGIIAGALAIAGLVALVGFVLGICCRYCFTCCECRPRPMKYDPASHTMIALDGEEGSLLADDSDYDEDNEEDEYHFNHLRNYDLYQTYPWNRKRLINFFLLLLFLAASICFDQFFLVGRENTTKGVNTIQSSFNDFNHIVVHVKNDSDILVDYGVDLNAEYSKAKLSCPIVNNPTFSKYINDYNSNVNSLQDYVAPLSSNVNDINDYFNYYAQGSFLFIFWGIFLVVFFLILLFVIFERRLGLQVMTAIGVAVEVFYILLGIIFICFVMIVGDLCEKPTYNVLNSLSNTNDIQNIANYYSTCQGNTTIQSDLNSATKYINQMYDALQIVTTFPCTNDPNLTQMKSTVLQINSTIIDLRDTTSCPPIQSIWFNLVNDGVCTEFYSGIFYIWGAQILTCLFFFITLIIVSINYQFYPKYPYVRDRLYQNRDPNNNGFPGVNYRMRSSSNESYFNIELPGRGRDSANDVTGRNDGSDDDDVGREDGEGV